MVIVTGGAGFIGSNLVHELNASGISDILVVDNFANATKFQNLHGARYVDFMDKRQFRRAISEDALGADVELSGVVVAEQNVADRNSNRVRLSILRHRRLLACERVHGTAPCGPPREESEVIERATPAHTKGRVETEQAIALCIEMTTLDPPPRLA